MGYILMNAVVLTHKKTLIFQGQRYKYNTDANKLILMFNKLLVICHK